MKMVLVSILCVIIFCVPGSEQSTDVSEYSLLQTVYLECQWGVWKANLVTLAESKIHCALLCSENIDCFSAQWLPEGSICHMFKERNLMMQYPLNVHDVTSTAIIGGTFDIILVHPQSGNYQFDFSAADQACQELGGRLITYTEMANAYTAGWLHYGSCGYVSNGNAYYVLQYLVEGTGFQGINSCYWASHWNAFCYLPVHS